MSRRRICVVTGSRADYGLLYWPMRRIAEEPAFELHVAATGMHLSPAFGETWRQIEADGFTLSAKVDTLVSGDTAAAVSKSVGLGVIGFADVLDRLHPDLMMVLGDRFEILAAVQAALFARVPVAHLCGGDTTEGAFDESIRHAITKMAHLHFATNIDAARRLQAMGENPANVHVTGSPGLDRIRHMSFLDRQSFFDAVGIAPRGRNLLAVFHPVTLDDVSSLDQVEPLLSALDRLGPDVGLIITGANADTEGQRLNARYRAFVESRPNAVFHMSLGSELYLNALKHADVLVGNSSSGLYEAPSFGTPSVNIGDRQKGRLRAESVIDCPSECDRILAAIEAALSRGRHAPSNPYGDGTAAEQIVGVLKAMEDFRTLLRKSFHDMNTTL